MKKIALLFLLLPVLVSCENEEKDEIPGFWTYKNQYQPGAKFPEIKASFRITASPYKVEDFKLSFNAITYEGFTPSVAGNRTGQKIKFIEANNGKVKITFHNCQYWSDSIFVDSVIYRSAKDKMKFTGQKLLRN